MDEPSILKSLKELVTSVRDFDITVSNLYSLEEKIAEVFLRVLKDDMALLRYHYGTGTIYYHGKLSFVFVHWDEMKVIQRELYFLREQIRYDFRISNEEIFIEVYRVPVDKSKDKFERFEMHLTEDLDKRRVDVFFLLNPHFTYQLLQHIKEQIDRQVQTVKNILGKLLDIYGQIIYLVESAKS